jgi:hypothetical protein
VGKFTTVEVEVKRESEGGDGDVAGTASPPTRPFSKIHLAVPAMYWYIYSAFIKKDMELNMLIT